MKLKPGGTRDLYTANQHGKR